MVTVNSNCVTVAMCHLTDDELLSNIPAGVKTTCPCVSLWEYTTTVQTIGQLGSSGSETLQRRFLFVVIWAAGFSITVTLSSYVHGAVWKYKHSSHLLVITTGTHGCVAQLNPGIVSLLEGLGRRGQGPFTKLLTNAVYTLLFFFRILFPKPSKV